MPANIPDLSAIHHLGASLNHDVFKHAQGAIHKKDVKNRMAASNAARSTAAARNEYARSASSVINQGRRDFAVNRSASQARGNWAGSYRQVVNQGRAAYAASQPASSTSFSHTPQTHTATPGGAQGTAAPTFSTQFSAHASPARPQGVATPTFQPPAMHNPVASTPVAARAMAPATFSSQFSSQAASGSPTGHAGASFSSPATPHTPTANPSRPRGVVGAQFSHGI